MTSEEKMLALAFRLDVLSSRYEMMGEKWAAPALVLFQIATEIRAVFRDSDTSRMAETEGLGAKPR